MPVTDQNHETEQTTADEPINPFAAWVQETRGGLLHSELSEALAEITRAVIQESKQGSLTLKITIKPPEGKFGPLLISDEIKKSVPEPDRESSYFYADSNGNLSRRDPRQPVLPFPRD